MFKLVLLTTLLAVAAARPSILQPAPLLLHAPTSHIIHEPILTKVAAVVKSIPTAVSHHSQSIVHSSELVVQPILAPVTTTTYAAAPILHAAPVVHTLPALSWSHAW